ncbi:hypothetical protein LTR62_007871 [Meristemomyces frigidus]|uniref:ATP-dependent DNA helicase II subunit 2 n=1 Tax=Meristemomyces frigidus TaxID=1508187 RepID=A0AAN7YD11_9PEZI|nr:hypothetical protein LTR62_007871 [Meristemomyces frigidus]
MASKEATVYIVDCGATMGGKSHDRSRTNLDWALEYIWDRITATVATGRKTAMAGIVALRTNTTKNPLDTEDDYSNITVLREIGQVLMPHVRLLREQLLVSSTEAGDAVSAIVVAMQMIEQTCKKLKYERKIVLVTDARGSIQTDGLEEIVRKLDEDGIELVVLGVDFDDAEYGFKEEGKDGLKAENEAVLKQLCGDCGGTFGTLGQAVEELGIPRVKKTKAVPSYKGVLTLGSPEMFETALSVDVERYPKTMLQAAPSASKFIVRGDSQAVVGESEAGADGEAGDGGWGGLTAVKNAMTYQIVDKEAAGGKRDVDRDELSKGYEYGRTAVHISESDRNVTLFETTPGFDIIGFVDRTLYERYLDTHRGSLMIAQRSNDKASMALSSFIHALYELDSYAVARLVAKENKDPRIVLLAPNIEPDFECLYDIELPFAEDMRSYRFPPLDRVVTVSGKELKVHRNLPSDELKDAMSDYVDSMDLSTFGKDDEGQSAEYMPMEETYAPMLHRLHQVIKHRAVFPSGDPPPPYEILTRYSHPPSELIEQSQPALDRLMEAANVKKVPPKARGKRYGRKEAPKPLSDLDVGALLAHDPKHKRARLDPRNAIPEFKQRVNDASDMDTVKDACKQMKGIIFDMIRHSTGSAKYDAVVEALRVMREEVVDLSAAEDYEIWNEVLRELKTELFAGKLGEGREELWYRVRVNRLGLLQARNEKGKPLEGAVGDEEARKFLLAR